MKDVSQFGEYTILKNYFQSNTPKYKYLVDIGAKGKTLSNTYNLIKESKWKGILIEPSSINFKNLQELYTKTEITLVKQAVADFNGFSSLYISDKKGWHSLIRKTDKRETVKVSTLPIILKNYKVAHDFDLLDIDAEGMDYRICKYMFQKSEYRPRVIIIEKGIKKDKIKNLFEKNQYRILKETKANYIWIKERKINNEN
jgi:FkbM family methyltransferase